MPASEPAPGSPRTPGKARAVFLDRDGVLNRNVFYADTQAFESPRTVDSLQIVEGAGAALRSLRTAGFHLILVSNQPNAAKGKCSREVLDQIHASLALRLADEGVTLDAQHYCFHHPAHTGPCACRKPSPFFLEQAAAEHALDLGASWMVGDRASDIECGRAAGVRTVWIDTGEGEAARAPDRTACSIGDAAQQILEAAARYGGRPAVI